MKYWEALLFKQREGGKSGLTIPFLIGSQEYSPINEIHKQSISELIKDIVSNASFEICLRICMNLNTLILEIRNPQNAVYYPSYNGREQSKLSIAIILKNKFGDSVENVIKILESEFQTPINRKHFSAKTEGNEREVNWGTFSNFDDIPFIHKAFKDFLL